MESIKKKEYFLINMQLYISITYNYIIWYFRYIFTEKICVTTKYY